LNNQILLNWLLARDSFLKGIRERSDADGLKIAGISLWETAMLCAKGRLKLNAPVLEWLESALRMPGLSVVQMDPRIAVDSSFLPGAFHGDPTDRLITATARVLGCRLVTFDHEILDYGKAGWVRTLDPSTA
jgi:PIN domain nuclease of toxin-antitoxin system